MAWILHAMRFVVDIGTSDELQESLSDDRLFLTKSSLGQTLTNSPTPEEILECIEEFSRRVETQKCLLNGVVIGVPSECYIKELSVRSYRYHLMLS